MLTTASKSTDKSIDRKDELLHRRLRDDAIPTIFEGLPHYFTSTSPKKRSETTNAQQRFRNEEIRLENDVENFLNSEHVESLAELREKLNGSFLPSSFIEIPQTSDLIYASMSVTDENGPKVKYSIVISSDLSFRMFSNDIEIPSRMVIHIVPFQRITASSDVLNILAYLGSYNNNNGESMSKDVVSQMIDVILENLCRIGERMEEKHRRKFDFLIEQFSLLLKEPKTRRFSSNLMATSILWHNISPSMYKQLLADDFLSLPCIG